MVIMFADRLIELLKTKKVSQAQISKDLGFGINQIRYWKKNKNVPNAVLVQKISEYLGVSIDYLLGKTDDMQSDAGLLSEDESLLVSKYRYTTSEGKARIMQSVLNICDEIEKNQ